MPSLGLQRELKPERRPKKIPDIFNSPMLLKKLQTSESLLAKCLHACSWVMIGNFSLQLLRMLRMWVLTWLLVPEMFGVLMLVWGVLAILREFSETGITHAIIQNPRGSQKEYMATGWAIILMRNLGLILVLILTAQFIAHLGGVYANPQLPKLLQVCALILFLEGLTSIGLVICQKELHFKSVVTVRILSQLVGFVVAIALAWWWRSVWAVVVSEIAIAAVLALLSYRVHQFRPGFYWNKDIAKELLGFGMMVFLASVLQSAGARLSVFILGKYASETELGFYGLGLMVIMIPYIAFGQLVVSVGAPALSRLQNDREKLKRAAEAIIVTTQILALPLFILIALLIDDVVRLMPEKYAKIGEVAKILCVFGYFQVFTIQLAPVLHAMKKVHWSVWRALIELTLLAGLVVPMYHYKGIIGVCWASNIAKIVSTIFLWLVVKNLLGWKWNHWCKKSAVLLAMMSAGAIAGLIVYLLFRQTGYTWQDNTFVRWTVCAVGIAAYVAMIIAIFPGKNSIYRQFIDNPTLPVFLQQSPALLEAYPSNLSPGSHNHNTSVSVPCRTCPIEPSHQYDPEPQSPDKP